MILHKSQFVNSREDIFGVEDPTPLTPTHVTVPHSFLIEEADKNFESFNRLSHSSRSLSYHALSANAR